MTPNRLASSRILHAFASRTSLRWIALAFAALLLAGCATGYGNQRVSGTVEDIDPRYGRIMLSTDNRYGNRGSRVALRFDRNTRLFYQGRQQAVAGLERGDGISVDVVRSNGELWARQIEVVHNVRDGGYYGGGDLRGAVSFVDPRAQVIGITRGGYSGRREQVRYDHRTVVEYRGRRVRPEQLEPGDVVSIQARPWGDDRLAERIRVERSVREY
ncbi:DUF5666 domain-containing protein [Novilysobacter erysipheiresistens]|uniref:DUF5666 domain-containing protein n=1 Tax=Novilysobacter erysipheiresistens TaxID=1749332 RepID=A0ABU7Z113_9GAMM